MTTLTYQPEEKPEFNEEELEAIQVGEQMAQEQDRALAGKFESAEELEKAYLELQSKFSSQQGETEEQPQEEQQEEQYESDFDFLETLWDEAQTEYSEETLERLGQMDASDVAQMYLEYRNNQGGEDARQLSDDEVGNLYDIVGGQDEYSNMIRWASDALDESEVQLYDSVMNSGNAAACFFAVQALAYRWSEMEGWEGSDFVQGGAAPNRVDAFRSQQEVVQAMSDPRYDNDPAYRQDVMNKLERSSELMY